MFAAVLQAYKEQGIAANVIDDKLVSFRAISADASMKQFYSVCADGIPYILLSLKKCVKPSEELFANMAAWQRDAASIFIEVAQTLAAHLPQVPAVYAVDQEHSLVLQSDCGQKTLYSYFKENGFNSEFKTTMLESLAWVAKLQTATVDFPASFIGLQRSLDVMALQWELKEFIDFGLCQGNSKVLPEDQYQQLLLETQQLAQVVAALPQALIHRDYQSKNILLNEQGIWIIDYQDMCLGPICYDLASLIYDPYLNLSPTEQEELAYEFWQQHANEAIVAKADFTNFYSTLQLCGIQRLLKAAGRYGYIFYVKGSASHMQYFQPAIKQAARLLQQQAYPLLLRYLERLSAIPAENS